MSLDEYITTLPKYSLYALPFQDHQSDAYVDCLTPVGLYHCYEFQNAMVKRIGGKVLNAACADDPARLGAMGATNLDIQVFEEHSKMDFSKVPNFIHGSVMSMPFEDGSYDVVVLGEFLEHCKMPDAIKALEECRRVLKPGGYMVITVPLDARPPAEQRGAGNWPEEYDKGITTFHQTWWSNEMLRHLKQSTRFVERVRVPLVYMLTCPLGGWGLVWQKPA